MKYLDFEINTGKKNMQIDLDWMDFAINKNFSEPIFRLYGWAPACVSLGRNQNDEFLDKNFLRKNNIDLVRRPTGGRALFHDKEITYCYICPVKYLENGESVVQSYKEISQVLIEGFKKVGIELEFGGKKLHTKFGYCMNVSTGADLCYQGKKFIGSAQFRKDGYILQHGSILLDYDKDLIERIFNEKFDETEIISLKQINPEIDIQTLFK